MVLEFADVGITYMILNSDDGTAFILYSRHLLSRHSQDLTVLLSCASHSVLLIKYSFILSVKTHSTKSEKLLVKKL